jgi:quercetin dioxygenase-like cupin family protein
VSHFALTSLVASVALVAASARAQSPALQAITPGEITWSQHPALPAGALRAVVYGTPTKPGPYVTRLRHPQGLKILPHTHPDDRIYTVLSGTLYLGLGDTWDESKLKAYPQGTVIYLPANLSHFQYSKSGEYLIQINGAGPTDLTFVNPSDDLRQSRKP